MSFGDVIHTMALSLQFLYFPLSKQVLNVERYGNLKYGFCRWLLNLSWCCVVNQAPVNINTTLVGKRSKRHGPGTNKVGRCWVSSALEIRIVKWWLMLSGDCSILFKFGYWDYLIRTIGVSAAAGGIACIYINSVSKLTSVIMSKKHLSCLL